ncbi:MULTISPECIES: helix-turn-helix domain-containing protein [unclassified Streptomyces]|uniref:helix-turn-helix domain-containing protein n=1 Tax=unclassified Streptomyces TaxID=2593676 RepID=UPI001F039297|nr:MULTISPECIES: helix-turn-helix domain-containing protein [unclassified Streptomyces]MCH0563127.1 helix-turn-helix domain-containing protein [Streptomyces sp. MUM 2J]MCH0573157.1 helix-turn-helix domain-containing protein [Streptomyces sp. MUM 136J]
MAEQKPIAAARPQRDVRRTTTHSGVIHVRTYQSCRYTVVGNHLAQHRELSLTAIGLATHILSLPEGAPVDIRSLADRFPEGRDRIAFALRELEACGYLERVRERTESGRLRTRTYAHHIPTGAAAGRALPEPASGASEVLPARQARVTDAARGTVAKEAARDRPQGYRGPSPLPADDAAGEEAAGEEAAVPPAPPGPVDRPEAPEARGDAPVARDRHHDRAVALLAGLRRTDGRLTLSRRQVDRLAPAVVAWFAGGATDAVVHRVLTTDLPVDMRHAAGVLAHRLGELLPVPLPANPPNAPKDTETGKRRRPDPFRTCDGCERAFRAPEPGSRCRDCRSPGPAHADGALRVA